MLTSTFTEYHLLYALITVNFLPMIENVAQSRGKLNDLLKHLYNEEGEQIVVSANQANFQLIFSCFHYYEVSVYMQCIVILHIYLLHL